MEIEESWDDEWSDVEYYDDDADHDYDDYEDDETETVPCPNCQTDVYEDAEQCPQCGEYIVHSGASHVWKDRPIWWVVLGGLGILAMIYVLIFVWV